MMTSVLPSGPELVEELDSSESWVVQPAAGFSVVTVGTTCQLPSSSNIPAGAKRQVTHPSIQNSHVTNDCSVNAFYWSIHTFDLFHVKLFEIKSPQIDLISV